MMFLQKMFKPKWFFLAAITRKRGVSLASNLMHRPKIISHVLSYEPGKKIQGFLVEQIREIPELHLAAVKLTHEKTGADYLHIARQDHNNVFSVAFRTTPQDDTGVAHILEHLVLCGSQNYPCRDPFFKMLNRSQATFMNAFTGSDYTMYPFSSQNHKDFENLLKVYLDAVFFPRLLEIDFRQEGWRLEHKNINDKNSEIELKGVVYNEMKGVFSQPTQLFAQELQNKLFPSSTYSYVSGGKPLAIPNLTWQQLKDFHCTHYHPSNARFFTYGDFPLENHLGFINDYVLSKFEKQFPQNQVLKEKQWLKPRTFKIKCQPDPLSSNPDKQTTVCKSYMLNDITDTYDSFTLNVLGNLLVDGPNAPFYRALIESGLGSDYSPVVGFDSHTRQSSFSVGLCGLYEKDVDTVIQIIDNTFHQVLKEGFPTSRIEGILHTIELSTKHQTSNFGLGLAMALNPIWNHGGDPIEPLEVNKHVSYLKMLMKDNPHFLQDKIHEHFISNMHNLTLIMCPHEGYNEILQVAETDLLKKKLEHLSSADKEKIYDEGNLLAMNQRENEDVSCLPSLLIEDIEKKHKNDLIHSDHICGVPVQSSEQPTNGISYFRALLSTACVPEELRSLIPLFALVVTKMGAGDYDYRQLDQEAELYTGGLDSSIFAATNPSKVDTFYEGILLSSFCLEKNIENMFKLWQDVINGLKMDDEERLKHIVKMNLSELSQNLAYQGHLYAMKRAASTLSLYDKWKEQMFGFEYLLYLKNLSDLDLYQELLDKLRILADCIFNKTHLKCALNANAPVLRRAEGGLMNLLSSMKGECQDPHPEIEQINFSPHSSKTHIILPYNVYYSALCFKGVPYSSQDNPVLRVAAKLMSSKFLHCEIRERGGAYGGGATVSANGNFLFYSYRDPNTSETLQAFQDSVNWILNKEFKSQDLVEAKLGVFSEVDKPVPPGEKGMKLFLNGLTDDMQQVHRDQLLNTTTEDVVRVVEKYLGSRNMSGTSLIGPEASLSSNSSEWNIINVEID
ncbi:presequence protease, mitochondrial-like [Limulus polyphemus]|uniref:Presequence protease, mitochondrial-like n=1 Tax=Limulus polyphemus TaxID=6850 RepID=A0ABM1B8P2_LIMPO|nr:presequence protease, mitochondrial-like [Limulus polyphemus]